MFQSFLYERKGIAQHHHAMAPDVREARLSRFDKYSEFAGEAIDMVKAEGGRSFT
jgi:hypothetical protein